MRTPATRTTVIPATGPVPNQPAEKAIYWPSAEFSAIHGSWRRRDQLVFPSEEAITTRRREAHSTPPRMYDETLCSTCFIDAARRAQVRIWILDPKFSTDDEVILETIVVKADAADIRVLSETHDERERERIAGVSEMLEQIANDRRQRPPKQVTVRWLPRLRKDDYPFLHDRFAILDDELWHFGATVGGGHKSLNAFTRGWNARETFAIRFFEDLWTRFEG